MAGYYTIVDGMTGMGNPIVPNGAASVETEKPSEMTGGAFTRMQVNQKVKKAIEAGSAADFFYFQETEPGSGVYDMRPKLPENGAASPEGPVFKLRENNNRMAKGIAQQFLNEKGEVDFEKGQKFLAELHARFPYCGDDIGVDKNNLTLPKDEVFRQTGGWLCAKFKIPKEEQADFVLFYDAAVRDGSAWGDRYGSAWGESNFISMWRSMAENGIAFRKMMEDQTSVFNSEDFQTNGKAVKDQAVKKYNQAEEELKRLAAMDPAEEKDMVVVTECTGSTRSNKRFREMAGHAKEKLEEGVLREVNPADFTCMFKAAPGESKFLKWKQHSAPVLGDFELEGKKYYLTAEAFAQETDTFVEHAGMTFGTAVGIYSDLGDFQKYYQKDSAVITDDFRKKLVDEKDNRCDLEYDNYDNNMIKPYFGLDQKRQQRIAHLPEEKKEIEEKVNNLLNAPESDGMQRAQYDAREKSKNDYIGDGWAKKFQKHIEDRKKEYSPTMGVNMEDVSNDSEVVARDRQKKALMIKERIPEQYRERFGALTELYASLSNQLNALNSKEGGLLERTSKIKEGSQELAETDDAIQEFRNMEMDLLPARIAAGTLIGTALRGEKLPGHINPSEEELLEIFLTGTGFHSWDMVDMMMDNSWKLLPPKEVRMEVQAGNGEVAKDFLEKGLAGNMQDLPDRAREFGVQNFDDAFDMIFSEEDKKQLLDQGKDVFDQIYIGEKSANELYGAAYQGYQADDKKEFIKCEVMRKILEGQEISTKLMNGERIPLFMTTSVPELSERAMLRLSPERLSAQVEVPEEQSVRTSEFLDKLENKNNPWYHHNSKEYNGVLEALRSVKALDGENASFQERMKAYNSLVEACDQYLEGKSGNQKTSLGRERFTLIDQLRKHQRQGMRAMLNDQWDAIDRDKRLEAKRLETEASVAKTPALKTSNAAGRTRVSLDELVEQDNTKKRRAKEAPVTRKEREQFAKKHPEHAAMKK